MTIYIIVRGSVDNTYNDASDTPGWVAASLEMLRNDGENTRWQCHVEEPMSLFSTRLELLEMHLETMERFILVVLTRDIGAERTKLVKQLLHVPSWSFDI